MKIQIKLDMQEVDLSVLLLSKYTEYILIFRIQIENVENPSDSSFSDLRANNFSLLASLQLQSLNYE